MPRGISLHIGLNYEDQEFDRLCGAVDSACAMKNIADSLGYKSRLLPEKAATKEAVTQAIEEAAKQLCDGDIFFLTYAGHGDCKRTTIETDGYDEGWFLSRDAAAGVGEASLFDDELYELLTRFPAGGRIVIVSDSCMSGGMLTLARPKTKFEKRPMFADIAARRTGKTLAPASVILMASCPEAKVAKDGRFYMLFTSHLLKVWNGGGFLGNYHDFIGAIRCTMTKAGEQVLPELIVGPPPNDAFLAQRPFTIAAPVAARAAAG